MVKSSRPRVDWLLAACPFLRERPEIDFSNGDTCIFGDVSALVRSGKLSAAEAASIFVFFNVLAEEGNDEDREVLATGALESFNDDAAGQEAAHRHLSGKALALVEALRLSWGQPDLRRRKT
jgi:hypothetical protein